LKNRLPPDESVSRLAREGSAPSMPNHPEAPDGSGIDAVFSA